MKPTTPALVEGVLRVGEGAHLSGWCALADDPGRRLVVEILVDGRLAVAMVAAQRNDGGGDGRNGFTLRLPADLSGPATRTVEARERDTGTIFGRTVLFADRIAKPIEERLSALDSAVLRAPMVRFGAAGGKPLHRVFGDLAAALRDYRCGALAAERSRLARRVPRLALAASPEISVILPAAATLEGTLERLVGLQALCDETSAEVLVADGGATPATLLLASALPGLRLIRSAGGLPGAALNVLAAQARGALLCFIDPDAPAPPWDLAPPEADSVTVGGSAAHALARLRGQRRPARPPAPGLALALSRGRLRDAGGFDSSFPFARAAADLAAKCALLGAAVQG